MTDDEQGPKLPQSWVCPCCKLSFSPKEKYIEHLRAMLAVLIGAAKKENVTL